MKDGLDRHLEHEIYIFDENRPEHIGTASWFDWVIDLYRQCHRGYYTKIQLSQLGTYNTLHLFHIHFLFCFFPLLNTYIFFSIFDFNEVSMIGSEK